MLTLQRRAALAAAAVTLMGALVGCNKAGPGAAGGGSALTDNIATVNGVAISKADFYTELQSWRPPPGQSPQPGETAGRAVLPQLIQNALIEQLAKKDGVYPTTAQIDEQYNNFKLLQAATSVKSFADQLADAGLTDDRYKSLIIVPQLCQINEATKGITVTDADIKAYYDKNKDAKFTQPNRAHIKRMVLATEADAKDVSSQLQKGTPFDQLYSRSIDKRLAGGELDQWLPLDSANPVTASLFTAIQKTPAGKTTPPVQFQGGWWLVDVLDKKPKEAWTFEQAKPSARVALLQEKIGTDMSRLTQLQQSLRSAQMSADIQVTEPGYKSLIDQLKNPPAMPAAMPSPPPTSAPPSAKMSSPPASGATKKP